MNFEAFTEDIRNNGWNVFGVEVYEQGTLTHTFGDTQDGLYEIFSAVKSILSVAMGIAWDRGLVDPDRPVLSFFPEDRIRPLSPEQKTVWEIISLRRLMTMSVPDLPFRVEGASWLDFALNCPVERPEEKEFNYSNVCAYLAGAALTESLGADLWAFIKENLLSPLGITRCEYTRCPEGYFYGASGMKMTVHDLSKIGLMLYRRGVWEGKRIVSAEYLRTATSGLQPCREGGYGYFFWKYPGGFSIRGKWGQRCHVLPDRGLVITYLSHMEEDSSALHHSSETHLAGIG